MGEPRRPYELTLKIGADSLEEVANHLHNLATEMYMANDKGGYQDRHTSVSGSPSSNHVLELLRTETADHDEYFSKLNAYLEEIRR